MKADNRDVQRISNLARGYDRNLCGKDFLICYGEEGNARMLEVAFSKKRFNHLVGIDIGQCHVKPWVLYKKALAGTLTPRDLGSSLSQYFPSKALAARMMNLFASSATHVSKVDPLSTRVNAEIWISGDAAQFAIGCLKVNAEYHSSSCYVPSSLQLLKPEKVDVKSSGERMPSWPCSAKTHRQKATTPFSTSTSSCLNPAVTASDSSSAASGIPMPPDILPDHHGHGHGLGSE